MTTRKQRTRVVAQAREQREAAAALRAQSEQARRQAGALVEASDTILDTAVAIAKEILERRRIPLAEPVAARFHNDERGSTGLEITVRLRDPAKAAAAKKGAPVVLGVNVIAEVR